MHCWGLFTQLWFHHLISLHLRYKISRYNFYSQQKQYLVFLSLPIFLLLRLLVHFVLFSFFFFLISLSSSTFAYLLLGLRSVKWMLKTEVTLEDHQFNPLMLHISKSKYRQNKGSPIDMTTTTTLPRWSQARTGASFPMKFPFHSVSGGHLMPEYPKPCTERKCHFLVPQSAFRKQMRQEMLFHLGV